MNVPAFLVLGGWIVLQFTNLGQVGSNVLCSTYWRLYRRHGAYSIFQQPHVRLFSRPTARLSAFLASMFRPRISQMSHDAKSREHSSKSVRDMWLCVIVRNRFIAAKYHANYAESRYTFA